jgi:hypothetical protein
MKLSFRRRGNKLPEVNMRLDYRAHLRQVVVNLVKPVGLDIYFSWVIEVE